MQASENPKTKKKREARPQTLPQLLKKLAEGATELAQTAERASQALRMQNHRCEKKQEAVMAILQQKLGIRDQVKRVWPLFSENDQETLKNFGFQEPRKGA
jgi:hypothetical protein